MIGIIIICSIGVWFLLRVFLRHTPASLPSVYGDVVSTNLMSRRALVKRVTDLETTIAAYNARLSELNLLQDENMKLKAELGRDIMQETHGVLAHVISLPNRSLYDTFTIDAGSAEGIIEGQIVYAFDAIALGDVTTVNDHTATVQLFSTSGRETTGTAVGNNVAVTLTGRGGGEYEVRMPREVHFDVGGTVAYQSVETAVLARIERIVTDPRDPFQRLLAKAPVNLQALKWVIVK